MVRERAGARKPPALTLVCSKTARAVEWRDFSFTSKAAARLRMRRGRTTLTSKPRGLMPLRLPAKLAKETSYEGFAVSVTDEQGNEVAYVPIGEAAN